MEFAEMTGPAGAVELEPRTILVIDDDPPIVEGLSELLQGAGDGRAALDQLGRGLRPCVIVLDLMMPAMDGWDFRHEQLIDAELSGIPVIVVTATGFSETSVKAQLGVTEVVPKPLSPERLLAAIERCCSEP